MKQFFYTLLIISFCCTNLWAVNFTVTNTNDAGAGSFRQAVLDANALAGADVIDFNIGGGGAQVINMLNVNINITEAVLIDGSTQPGYAGTPLITLNKSFGLDIVGANNVTIQDFIFTGNGYYIEITGSSQNIIIQRNNFQHGNGANDYAIQMTGGQDITISNNSFTNSTYAIILNSVTSGVSITGDNTFSAGNALTLSNMSNQHISSTNAGGANIVFQDGCGINNQFIPINIGSCNDVLVENLSIIHPTGGGYAISTSNCNRIIVQNNTIANFRSAASFTNGTDAQVLNNSFTNTGYGPSGGVWSVSFVNVAAGALPRAVIFQGNTFNGGPYMLRIEGMPNQIITDGVGTNPLTNIFLTNTSGHGTMLQQLMLENTNNVIIDNINFSRPSGTTGIGLSVGNSNGVTLQNCIFARMACGITMSGCDNTTILNNSFTNAGYGVNPSIGSCVSLNTITNVTFSGATFTNCGNGVFLAVMNGAIISDGTYPGTNITLPNTGLGLNTTSTALRLNLSSNVVIRNLDLSRPGSNYTINSTGLWIQSCNLVDIANLTIQRRAIACNQDNTTNITLACSFIGNNRDGIYITGTSTQTIQNTNFICNTGAVGGLVGTTITATNNYWGANNGSTHDGGGGDYAGTFGVLTTNPFLTAPAPCAPNLTPEINLKGNGVNISNNDLTPSTTDNTDLGTVVTCATPVVRTFRIENNGGVNLTINSRSSNNAAFVISGLTTPLSIPAGGFTTFNVTFTPAALGATTASITLNNTDCREAVYNFNMSANVIDGLGEITRGSALTFDNNDDYVNVGSGINVANTSFSVEAWVKRNSLGTHDFIIGQGPEVTNQGLHIGFRDNNTFTFAFWFNDVDSPIYTDLEWHHWACTFNATTKEQRIYRDGILVASRTAPSNYTGTGNLIIGNSASLGNPNHGSIDEVRIWSGVRTAQQVRENMHLTLKACYPTLLAYYQMNEGAGTTLADKSGRGNNGTLVNGPTWSASTINVGHDAIPVSNSQTINSVPTDTSTQNFAAANVEMRFFAHSAVEDYTVTYQEFAPNAVVGVTGATIFQNPMWTINKSSSTATQLVDYTFTYPVATFTSLDPTKYSLYWRAMNADGNWTKIATAHSVTATTAGFGKISLTGQFIVVQESDELISDVRGNMYDLDGVDDYISLGNPASLNFGRTTPFSIEAWTNLQAFGTYAVVFSKMRLAVPYPGYEFRIEADGKLRFVIVGSYASNMLEVLTSTSYPNDNAYHHVAVSYTGSGDVSGVTIYIDGVAQPLTTSYNTLSSFAGTTSDCRIGSDDNGAGVAGYPFTGKIDEVRIWSAARTQAEIRENMHLTLKGDETGLVSYYQFNNDDAVGTAAGVKDAMGNNNGTTVNMAATTYIPSEVAVAGGTSDRITIGAAGVYNFPNTSVSIDFGATTPNGELVISRLETEKPHGWASITGDVDNEYFVIRNYGTNQTFTVLNDITLNRLSYISPADVGVPQVSSPLNLYKRASNAYAATWGTTWGGADNASAGTNGMVSYNNVNNVTSFSQIVIVNSSTNSDLPIELLSFSAKRKDANNVALDWSTASELNNQGFYIERMMEVEQVFESIAFVDGKGTATNTSYYQLMDDNSYTGVSYYRLRQVDFDGTISYSDIRAVAGREGNNNEVNINVYPNPVKDQLTVRFNELPKEVAAANIKILSIDGRVLHQFNKTVISFQQVSIDFIQNLPSALYMLVVELDNGEKMVEKFVKE